MIALPEALVRAGRRGEALSAVRALDETAQERYVTPLIRERGAILIDPGGPRFGRAVLRRLRRVLDGPREIRLTIATHGHFDHIGAAAELRALPTP